MESIGSELKQARESKGLSIEQVQKDTRIHSTILRALEEDRIAEVSSTLIYTKSFMRKYADYLGLDGPSLVEEYFKGRPKSEEQVLTPGGERKSLKLPIRRAVSVGVVILVVILGFRLLAIIGSKIKAAFKSRPPVSKKVEAKPVTQTPQTPKAIPPAAKVPVAAQIQKSENLLLTIKARRDVWLKVTSDGSVVYDGILKNGLQENWQAAQSLEISTSRAEALNAELNGTKLAPFGKGVIKGVLITKEGLKLPK